MFAVFALDIETKEWVYLTTRNSAKLVEFVYNIINEFPRKWKEFRFVFIQTEDIPLLYDLLKDIHES